MFDVKVVKVVVFSTIRFVLVMALLMWGPWSWPGRPSELTVCPWVGVLGVWRPTFVSDVFVWLRMLGDYRHAGQPGPSVIFVAGPEVRRTEMARRHSPEQLGEEDGEDEVSVRMRACGMPSHAFVRA